MFLAASAALAGCQTTGGAGGATATRVVDAGSTGKYATDGVYSVIATRDFLIRNRGKLTAISAICTHRKCKLDAEPDRTFYCPCHGSTFDPMGKVTEVSKARSAGACDFHQPGGPRAGHGADCLNLMAERTPSTRKTIRTMSCAILNGGSVCVGARALRNGIFARRIGPRGRRR